MPAAHSRVRYRQNAATKGVGPRQDRHPGDRDVDGEVGFEGDQETHLLEAAAAEISRKKPPGTRELAEEMVLPEIAGPWRSASFLDDAASEQTPTTETLTREMLPLRAAPHDGVG